MSAKKKTQQMDSPAHRDYTSLIAGGAGTPFDLRNTGIHLTMEMGDGGSGDRAGRGSSGCKMGIASAGRNGSGSGGGYTVTAAQWGEAGSNPITPLEGPVRRLYGDDDEEGEEERGVVCATSRGSLLTSMNTTVDDLNGTGSSLSIRRGPATTGDSPQTMRRKRTLLDASGDEDLGGGGGDEDTNKRLNTSTMTGLSPLHGGGGRAATGTNSSMSSPYCTRLRAHVTDRR